MNLDLGSFAFGTYLNSGTGTPSWGTALGQSQPAYKFTYPGAEVILIGMMYCSVPLNRVSLPLGKGGRVYKASEIDECQIASLFRKVYINGTRINYPFIMVLVKESSESHPGRKSIKYTDKITYSDDSEQYSNIDFIRYAQKTLGLTEEACWFVYSLEVYNQDELHMSAVIVDKDNSVTYQNSSERRNEWLDLIPDSSETSFNKTSIRVDSSEPLQQIFYGAPGTGKSKTIKDETEKAEKDNRVFRTTFHPDSDYSTFVGCYKPTMKPTGVIRGGEQEEVITYKFTPQAFTNAYVKAWNTEEDVYLIIEEINRGNCAQIFGDLFQLLDRNDKGLSEYPINADSDLASHIAKELAGSSRIDFPDEVKEGKKLVLPKNLFIWATMNTSDQSLFPIDSAFKRRWDWKYIKISEGMKDGSSLNWKILVEDEEQDRVRLYDWWKFLQLTNTKIFGATQSADKQMGYFFTKATETFNGEKIGTLKKEGIEELSGSVSNEFISAETFVNKVLFYLWTDVLKDNEYEEIASLMKDGDKELSFPDFFDKTGKDINARAVRAFLENVMKDEDVKCEIAEWSYEGQNNQTSFKPKSMIIKITDNIQDENALYQRAKGWWRMAEKKADTNVIEYVYIYSTPVRKIVACYHVSKWDNIMDDGKKRFGFEGVSVQDTMIGQPADIVAHARGQVVFYPK